ncbi:hypothetical protein CROQUDRAFT_666120, partial [Cronartium quercuum f. sp. fusiforme G11]
MKIYWQCLLHEGLSGVAVKLHLQSMVNLQTITCWKQLYESTLAVVKSADTYQKCGQPLDFMSEEHKFFFLLY